MLLRGNREPIRERDLRELREREGRAERERLMPFDLPPHGELKSRDLRIERGDYEPLLPREAIAMDTDKPTEGPQGEASEHEKADSLDEEDDGKAEDAQSVVSAGEEYEPISDDELDEILADSAQKRDEQQEDEKTPGPLDVIDVDWSSLMPKQKPEPRAAGAALLRFTPGAVLLRSGVSAQLAGPQLLARVREVCSAELDDPKDADQLFEHDLGALNMAALSRKEERGGLLRNLGPCSKALCARRDLVIRRQLLKNDKGTTKQIFTSAPVVVDNELLQLSVRLFKKKMAAGQPSANQEKAETGAAALRPNTPTEVCVS